MRPRAPPRERCAPPMRAPPRDGVIVRPGSSRDVSALLGIAARTRVPCAPPPPRGTGYVSESALGSRPPVGDSLIRVRVTLLELAEPPGRGSPAPPPGVRDMCLTPRSDPALLSARPLRRALLFHGLLVRHWESRLDDDEGLLHPRPASSRCVSALLTGCPPTTNVVPCAPALGFSRAGGRPAPQPAALRSSGRRLFGAYKDKAERAPAITRAPTPPARRPPPPMDDAPRRPNLHCIPV
ncbi:hypothetical protein B0H15DRAFT_1024136 [Mycena belliarum]|uniref:Uncharacterized protein n=1 Tax=Mycena belliarum TaxID=1033014 RepID=A0AAD6TXT4_9AGAR|nr:hypothetical protein B0H15DRAFT_1024136 [Mycena belliae]